MGIPINRLKVILAENKKTSRWLAESLGKNEATVSRWCTNESQPSVEMFFQIARLLDIDIRELTIEVFISNTKAKSPLVILLSLKFDKTPVNLSSTR